MTVTSILTIQVDTFLSPEFLINSIRERSRDGVLFALCQSVSEGTQADAFLDAVTATESDHLASAIYQRVEGSSDSEVWEVTVSEKEIPTFEVEFSIGRDEGDCVKAVKSSNPVFNSLSTGQ